MFKTVLLMVAALFLLPMTASAYIGPGMGAGAISAVIGVLAAVGLTLFSLFYYPIKRALKKRRPQVDADIAADADA